MTWCPIESLLASGFMLWLARFAVGLGYLLMFERDGAGEGNAVAAGAADVDEEADCFEGPVDGADLERLHGMMRRGESREALAECQRLIDLTEGIDEAAMTDARWAMRGRVAA